jgi:hypothetical protein
MQRSALFVCVPLLLIPTAWAAVNVSSPSNGSTVQSPVHFSATAGGTSCPTGVASMGIYTAPGVLAYTVNGTKLSADLSLSPGTYYTTVEQWDHCGGAATTPITIKVISSGGKTFYNLQASKGWKGYGELPPKYNICSTCSGVTWSLAQGVSSPSMDGKSAKFSIGGSTPYADVLWNNHLIGDGTTQGMPDTSHTIVPNVHNFTYDAYFYSYDLLNSENIEFDVAQFFNNMGFMYGTQCEVTNGGVWDVWDAANGKWIKTSIPCKPLPNAWNHVIIKVARTSDNKMLYKSFTLNGVTHDLNWTYSHFSAPGWYGIVINFQLDGNYKLWDYAVYLDKLNLTYY